MRMTNTRIPSPLSEPKERKRDYSLFLWFMFALAIFAALAVYGRAM